MRATLIAAAAAATLALAGCGGSGGSGQPKLLDTERIERSIENSILQKRKLVASVSCPSGIERKKGKRFRCMATFRGGQTPFLVTERDDRGSVNYVGLRK
ncbi:MAG: DUF4333 domain-containing protein [Thermoleophilaceae bacterium]